MKAGPGRVRISGGELRGRWVSVPTGARPTEGQVREALCSIWRDRISGARVLDLFAGSGAVALEALSRGAASALACDADGRAIRTLQETAKAWGVIGLRALRMDLLAGLTRLASDERPFDLIFADPPYAFDAYEQLLSQAEPLLAEDGELALEHAVRASLPATVGKLERFDERRYGAAALSFWRRVTP